MGRLQTYHKAIIQELLHHRFLSEQEIVKLGEELKLAHRDFPAMKADVTRDLMRDLTSTINQSLNFFSLKIVYKHFDGDGSFYYGIVNMLHDDIAKSGTALNPKEVVFFANLRMALEEAKKLDELAACNVHQESPVSQRLTVAETEVALSKLADEGWIYKCDDGTYMLGPRSVLQM